jgi:hypothetical protein
MKRNLTEEIYRMRKLMGYDSKSDRENITSLDRLTENKIVNQYFINEQTKVSSTIYNKLSGTYNRTELPNIMNDYDPNSGYLRIEGGNSWLAEQRAKNLATFLSSNVEKQVLIPFNKDKVKVLETAVSENTGDEYQYVEGTLYAIMERPPIVDKTYIYSLKYNFYEVDGEPHILVTKSGMGVPQRIVRINAVNAYKYPKNFMTKTPTGSKLVWQQFSQFRATESQPAGNGYLGIMIPLESGPGYSKKDGNALYFDSPEELNAMRDFISKWESDEDKFPSGRHSSWTSTMGGGGSYGFGNSHSKGAKAIELPTDGTELEYDSRSNVFINPKKIITIRRTSADTNTGEGGSTIPNTGQESKWVKIGEFNLTKSEGAFADNMVKVQEGTYQKIFDELKTAVEKYLKEDLDIIEISASVKGFASADMATNRTNIGKPDHDWGVGFPIEKWIMK